MALEVREFPAVGLNHVAVTVDTCVAHDEVELLRLGVSDLLENGFGVVGHWPGFPTWPNHLRPFLSHVRDKRGIIFEPLQPLNRVIGRPSYIAGREPVQVRPGKSRLRYHLWHRHGHADPRNPSFDLCTGHCPDPFDTAPLPC